MSSKDVDIVGTWIPLAPHEKWNYAFLKTIEDSHRQLSFLSKVWSFCSFLYDLDSVGTVYVSSLCCESSDKAAAGKIFGNLNPARWRDKGECWDCIPAKKFVKAAWLMSWSCKEWNDGDGGDGIGMFPNCKGSLQCCPTDSFEVDRIVLSSSDPDVLNGQAVRLLLAWPFYKIEYLNFARFCWSYSKAKIKIIKIIIPIFGPKVPKKRVENRFHFFRKILNLFFESFFNYSEQC